MLKRRHGGNYARRPTFHKRVPLLEGVSAVAIASSNAHVQFAAGNALGGRSMDDLGGVVAGDGVFQQVHEAGRECGTTYRTSGSGDVGIRAGFSARVWRSLAGAANRCGQLSFTGAVRDGDDSWIAVCGVGSADFGKQF